MDRGKSLYSTSMRNLCQIRLGKLINERTNAIPIMYIDRGQMNNFPEIIKSSIHANLLATSSIPGP